MAGLLGVSERVVLGRKADGRLPTASDGRIDLRAVAKAGVAALAKEQGASAASPLDDAKLDETRERTKRLRLQNELLAGASIYADVAEDMVGAAFDAVRAKVLSVPSSLGPRLAAVSDPNEARELLTKVLHDALGDLSDGEIVAAIKDRSRRLAGRAEGGDPAPEEAGAAA